MLIALISACAAPSCQNLSDVWYAIDDIDDRLTSVEEKVEKMNTNIDALTKVCDALRNNVSISRVIRLQDNTGYEIVFSDGTSAVIKDGVNGKDGNDGKDGDNGKDGHTPAIAVAYDSVDGYYYWTVDGEPLLDASGNRVRANGVDAVVPCVAVGSTIGGQYVQDATYISVDGGKTWTRISGESGAAFFDSVTVDEASGKVKMVLADGTALELPYVKDFMFAFAKTEVMLSYGFETDVDVNQSGVATYQIVKPDGWKATLDGNVLHVKSPSAKNDFADTEGDIAVIAVSKSGFTSIAKLKVGILGGSIDVETTTGSRTVTLKCAPNGSVSDYRVYSKVFTEVEAAAIDDESVLEALDGISYQRYSGDKSVTLKVPDGIEHGSKAVTFILVYDQKGALAGVRRVEFTVTVGRVALALSGSPTLTTATINLTPNEWTDYYFLWVGKKSILESFKINEKDPASLINFLCQDDSDKEAIAPMWLNVSGNQSFESLDDDTEYKVVCVPVDGKDSKVPVGYLTLLDFKTISKSEVPPTVSAEIVSEASDWLYTSVKYKFSLNSTNLYAMIVTQEEWDAYLKNHQGQDNRGYLTANAAKYTCESLEQTIRFDTHPSTPIYILSMTENPSGAKSEIVTTEYTTRDFVKGIASLGLSINSNNDGEITDNSVIVHANVSNDAAYYLIYCATEKQWSEISSSPELKREFICRRGIKVEERGQGLTYKFSELSEDTKYYIIAVAVDENGRCEEYAHSVEFRTAKKESGSGDPQ